MAIYHLSVKPVSRAGGRSATAASAYRAAELVYDETTGESFDYTRKRGVEHAEIVLPTEAREAGYQLGAGPAAALERRRDGGEPIQFPGGPGVRGGAAA